MKKPKKMFRRRCSNCGAAFSGPDLSKVAGQLERHDCAKEQQKAASARDGARLMNSIFQGAMLGMLGHALSAANVGAAISADLRKKGVRTPNPLFGSVKNPAKSGHAKSTRRAVEKPRRKPPSQ